MESKSNTLKTHLSAGRYQEAVRIAARFPRLGDIRDAVLNAHMAYTNPRFVVQIKKDPAQLIEEGKAALIRQFL